MSDLKYSPTQVRLRKYLTSKSWLFKKLEERGLIERERDSNAPEPPTKTIHEDSD